MADYLKVPQSLPSIARTGDIERDFNNYISSMEKYNRELLNYIKNFQSITYNSDDKILKIGDVPNGNYYEFTSSGLILHGDCKVDKRLQIPVNNFGGAGVNPATAVSYGFDGAYSFSKTISESVAVAMSVPYGIDYTEPAYFAIGWSSAATTGICRWQLEVLYRRENEAWNSTTPDATIISDVAPSTTANGLVITRFALPEPNPLGEAGGIFRLTRVGGAAQDTMDNVAYVFGGAIDYTQYLI